MNICSICGYKQVSNKRFEIHKATHEVQYPEVAPVVEEVKTEPVVEAVPEPLVPLTEEITLRFTKPVEITINGKQYFGKEIVVKDMSLAAELVRIARDGYGPTILA
ncbi:MAG: hypothetical protein NUV86_09495 [Candidatus Scalindua sp.]|nr:hypothetical protein [Candidatus Scalindua sp.]